MAGLLFAASLIGAVPASAQTGGAGPPGSTTHDDAEHDHGPDGAQRPGPTATLQADGTALAPAGAPRQVRKAIAAANKIHTRPLHLGRRSPQLQVEGL